MVFLNDIFHRTRKHCKMCGCNLMPESESDICECCLDDLYDSDPGEPDEE